MVQVYLPGKHPILPEVPVGSKMVGTHPMSPWVVEANSINKELFLMVKNQHCISLYKSNCIYYYIILYNTTDKYILYIIYYNIYIYITILVGEASDKSQYFMAARSTFLRICRPVPFEGQPRECSAASQDDRTVLPGLLKGETLSMNI